MIQLTVKSWILHFKFYTSVTSWSEARIHRAALNFHIGNRMSLNEAADTRAWNAGVVQKQFQLVLQAIQIARGIEPKSLPAAMLASSSNINDEGLVG